MGIFEGITHSEEIEDLINDAQSQYDDAHKRLETQKKSTTKSLESLGKLKIKSWSKDMSGFLDAFGAFSNVQMVEKINEDYEFLGKNESSEELMINIRNASLNANEILKDGAISIGTGALVGVATYGGVAMFAKASTGTAIAALNGAAKKNATLAWLGGGSIASGGFGIKGGSVVLGGVVVGAIAVVGGMIASSKGKAKLAEAKKMHAEAEAAVSKMNVVITEMDGIQNISENYKDFIKNFSKLFSPYIKEMNNISAKYQRGEDGKINFTDLSEMEQKTLHLSWLLAQVYYHILSEPLLSEEGKVNSTSRKLLQKAQQEYTTLSNQATELESEKKQIRSLLDSAKKSFSMASKNYYDEKEKAVKSLETIGRKRIILWKQTFGPFLTTISSFENINVENIYPYRITNIPIEFIFESTESILKYLKSIESHETILLGKTGLVEIALFGGEDFLGELSQIEINESAFDQVHRHDMSLWFTGALEPKIAENIEFSEVSDSGISIIEQTIDGISGRENLKQATEIHTMVETLSNRIETAISDFKKTISAYDRLDSTLSKYNRIQSKYLQEILNIKSLYQQNGEPVQYDNLSETEKRVFEMAFVIAKIQYTILASCLLSTKNGGDEDNAISVINNNNEVFRYIRKDTFKCSEKDLQVANILWKEYADIAMFISFGICTIWLILMVMQLAKGSLVGLAGILGIIAAFPIFFYFKKLSQSQLFMWRYIRIILSAVIVIGIEILV